MVTAEEAWKKTDGSVRYHESETIVELGDYVKVKGWFRTKKGRVNYVPGKSEYHAEMEHNSLYWVGVAFDNGTETGILVDPETGCVLKSLAFLDRGSSEGVRLLADAPWE